jgi:hypothetical protein
VFNLAQYGVPVLGATLALAVVFAPARRAARASPEIGGPIPAPR